MLTYTYKDGSRYYWTLTLKMLPLDKNRTRDTDSFEDHEWIYTIYRCGHEFKTDPEYLMYTDRITGIFDVPPHVSDVMRDFLGHMNALAIGFSQYGKEISQTPMG